MVFRSLTGFPRKGDLKISLTGAAWSRCLSNSCKRMNELRDVHYIKGIIRCFYLVLNHQVISVTTFSYQLSCIMFCNQYRFALYRAQRKSKKFIFPTAASSLSLLTMQRVCYNWLEQIYWIGMRRYHGSRVCVCAFVIFCYFYFFRK